MFSKGISFLLFYAIPKCYIISNNGKKIQHFTMSFIIRCIVNKKKLKNANHYSWLHSKYVQSKCISDAFFIIASIVLYQLYRINQWWLKFVFNKIFTYIPQSSFQKLLNVFTLYRYECIQIISDIMLLTYAQSLWTLLNYVHIFVFFPGRIKDYFRGQRYKISW